MEKSWTQYMWNTHEHMQYYESFASLQAQYFHPFCLLETGRSTANGFLVSVDYWTSGMTLFFSFVHISRPFISTIRYLHINMQDEEQDVWY